MKDNLYNYGKYYSTDKNSTLGSHNTFLGIYQSQHRSIYFVKIVIYYVPIWLPDVTVCYSV